MNTDDRELLIKRLLEFSSAAQRIADEWVGTDGADSYLTEGYPFPRCFVETADAISDWADSAVKRLKTGETK